jgi:hypothetical protein
MAYTNTNRATPSSEKSKTIVGRDRLRWRRANGRLFLFYGNNDDHLAIVEPDAKYAGMYRIRFPDGGLSDMVNLTRAKDAALAFALRSLNSVVQETPSEPAYVRNKRRKVVEPEPTANRLHEGPNDFLAEGRS